MKDELLVSQLIWVGKLLRGRGELLLMVGGQGDAIPEALLLKGFC